MKKIILIFIFSVNFIFASNILIINSYHKGYEWSDSIINGIEETLYNNLEIDINILYMDSKRVTSKDYFDNLRQLYKVQLKDRKYDLIIAVDRFAYDFLLDIYNEIFSNEPILTVGIENFSYDNAKKYGVEKNLSVLLEKRDLKGNIKVIEKFMPSIKKLYIINDKSLNALHTEPLIQELIDDFNGTYELIYLKEDSLEDLEKRFFRIEEDSAALFIRFYKNRDGELNKNQEIARVIKNAKIPIFITDSIFIKKGAIGGKIVDLNKFGHSSGKMTLEILNKKISKVVISDDFYYVFDAQKLEEFSLPINALHEEYKLVNQKLTFYDRNRGLIDFVFTISPLLVFLILGLIHNIYMRKRVEKDLRQRIEFDVVLLNAIESPIFWQDEKGVIVDSNSKFCSLLKLDCENIYGKKIEDFIDNRNVRKIIRILNKYKENTEENYEFKYFDDSLRKKIYLVKQEKFEDKNTKKEGLVTIFTDITKEKEIAIEKQRNKQFIIQQSKLAEIGEIFSSIAHQWKAPLVEITAIAQELFYTKSYKEIKEDDSFVSDIMKQVNYMTTTINDFQKFIMPSNKKVEFNVKEAIKSMLEIVNHNMKYNNIKIDVNVQKNSNLNILGYKNEFMQSVLNIVNNAKDTLKKNDYKDRKIDIKVFNNEEDKLFITLEDNGGGIPKEHINKIFDSYFTTKENGHGIGLYMSKMIIEDKMGGEISVKNINDGAMFTIKLDLKK